MKENSKIVSLNRDRRAGVLLHPTSLPGPYKNGDIGHQAYRFIEFLSSSGFKVWQMLPLGPTHDDKSPYQCMSTHAGNPQLISLDWLEDKHWLDRNKIKLAETDDNYRLVCLEQAGSYFYRLEDKLTEKNLKKFKKNHQNWLDDFSLFMALKKKYSQTPWYQWPDKIRHRDSKALETEREQLKDQINQVVFEQFVFFTQWHEVRGYAKQHNVELFGDMPIFVAKDSADVWAQRKNFLMNSDGQMEYVAGVPPDAFSATGQRWGNPLYDWQYMALTKFDWWKERFATQLELFDMIRLDHFRGLQASWHIPARDDTAINGEWVEVPGQELLTELNKTFHHLPLIAEDLGVITDEVIDLKNSFNLPGMKVLQFAFDGNNKNPHLPHCHHPDDIVYSGTHDNNTTLGWIKNKSDYDSEFFKNYLNIDDLSDEDYAWSAIRLAMASVSFMCVLPMQDLLLLDSSARMNVPGTTAGNWSWRFNWEQLNPETVKHVLRFNSLYQR